MSEDSTDDSMSDNSIPDDSTADDSTANNSTANNSTANNSTANNSTANWNSISNNDIRSRTAAIRSETDAIRSRTAAKISKYAAISSKNTAISSKTAASLSQTDASFSWSAASLSWTDVSLSEAEISLTWDNAICSETAVISSRIAAIRSETAAIRSETDAIRSQTETAAPIRLPSRNPGRTQRHSLAMNDTPSTSSDSEEGSTLDNSEEGSTLSDSEEGSTLSDSEEGSTMSDSGEASTSSDSKEEEHSDTCSSDDMNEDERQYYEDLALNPRQPPSFDRFLDLPKELRLMIYEYAADCRRRFRFVNRNVAITNYKSITPIHLTCRAICGEAAPLMKSIVEAQRVLPQAMRVPRIIVNGLKCDGLDDNSEVISKISSVCEEARSKKVSVIEVDIIMRERDECEYGETYWSYYEYCERACEVFANFANSAAMYFARHDHTNSPSSSFPRLSNDEVVVYVALVDTPIEETSVLKDIGYEMQQHVGPCMDSTEDIQWEYSVIGPERCDNEKHRVVLYDVGREPREWYQSPLINVYYGGVIDEETWERDWT